MKPWVRRVATGVVRIARDGWLIVGIAALFFFGMEVTYRLVGSLRSFAHAVRAGSLGEPSNGSRASSAFAALPRLHPYADSAWYAGYLAERERVALRWEPFVYYRAATLRGAYLNIDSSGLRVVPRYPVLRGKPLRVFFFGGSTTWGYDQRDANTRPAVVARRLAAAGYDAEVLNFAQHGYTSGQELLALVIELRRGNTPDVVVFWDGVNDVAAARQNVRPGVSYREFDRVEDAALNTRRRARGGVDAPLAIRSLAHSSALLTRLLERTARSAPMLPLPDPVGFCQSLMRDWLGYARVIDGLARAYGFEALVVWQPQWETAGRGRRGNGPRRPLTLSGGAPAMQGLGHIASSARVLPIRSLPRGPRHPSSTGAACTSTTQQPSLLTPMRTPSSARRRSKGIPSLS